MYSKLSNSSAEHLLSRRNYYLVNNKRNSIQLKFYPRSWYPVARSGDLGIGRIIPVHVMSEDWVLFRGDDGKVGIIQRFCCHMGTDLAQGKVVNNNLVCPLHGWCFNSTGNCVYTTAKTKIVGSISTGALRCLESCGLVFVFWGDGTPDFEFPLSTSATEAIFFGRPFRLELNSDYHVPCLNTFDTQHYEPIHNRQFIEAPEVFSRSPFHLQINYRAKIIKKKWLDYLMCLLGPSVTCINIECWGASILVMRNIDSRFGAIISMVPTNTGKSRIYIVAFKSTQSADAKEYRFFNSIAVAIGSRLVKEFLKPDLSLLNNMRPVEGKLIDRSDDAIRRYWNYWYDLPRWSGYSPEGV